MFIYPPWLMVIFAVLFGAIMGSYVNMAAYRLPRFISTITRTRSFCPKCKRQLTWYENLPVVSFLIQRGRCRGCQAAIPSRYLWVELLVSTLFGLVAYQYFQLNNGPRGAMPVALVLLQLFFVVDMVLLSVVDLEMWIIPIQTTLPWAVVGLILAPIFPELHSSAAQWWPNLPRLNAFVDSFLGLAIGAGAPWTFGLLTTFGSFVWFKFKGDSRRPLEGMGDGDTHLMGMVGAMLGWKPALLTLMLGVFIGSTTGVAKIWWERFQYWRLKDKYKPWQPTYETTEGEAESGPEVQVFWPLLVMAIVVMLAAGFLYERSVSTWDAPQFVPPADLAVAQPDLFNYYDMRLVPVLLMFLLSMLLVFAWVFKSYLAKNNLLPQGDIVENEEGKKEEVLQGNYVPFGPSLAMGALLVSIYDPLLRNVAYWFYAGCRGNVADLPWRLLGEAPLMHVLTGVLGWFNALMQSLVAH